MNITSPFPAILITAFALFTMFVLSRFSSPINANGRYQSIDGLRGFLALGVYIQHSCIWYAYSRTGKWQLPESNLYIHFGQGTVVIFFMITGFLFTSKILQSRKNKIDWLKLFISRFLRIVPLYICVMAILFLIIGVLSEWKLRETPANLISGIAKWLTFKIWGGADINAIEHTSVIVAGATWTLVYEWYFYMALPLLALALARVPSPIYVIFSLLCVFYFEIWHASIYHLAFLGGIISAILFEFSSFRRVATSKLSSLLILVALAAEISFFPNVYTVMPIVLYALIFSLISSGNDIFGILSSSLSRAFGELAFGIYLIHGLILFVLFTFILGPAAANTLSPLQYWGLIMAATPVLIIFSFLSFRFIEKPAMGKVGVATRFVRLWTMAVAGWFSILRKRVSSAEKFR